jgi:chromosome segregation protein
MENLPDGQTGMRIKQVDIIGFKSFVDKASLPFQEGVNVVVGPNGCGKSNILDAIRWAMGEQSAKSLRGSSMEDVIFKGSAARKGLGMAEVSLIFSAEDGIAPEPYGDCSEIMVTRRLFRDGESEYYVNKSRCRRTDIQELFLDTGVGAKSYSIIEQGNIETILRDRPEERRSLIEDAAGVMKFKVRKKAALRKIEAARLNLGRLEDVISEVRRQSAALKRQAQKAERFRECRRELKAIEIGSARRRYQKLKEEESGIAALEQQRREALEQLAQRIAGQEEELSSLKARQAAREQEIQASRSILLRLAADMDQGLQQLDFNRREAERLVQDGERIAQERKELETRQQGLLQERDELIAELQQLDGEIAAGDKELQSGMERLAFLQEAEERQSRSVAAVREKLFSCLGEISRFANQREEAERRLEVLEGRLHRNREDTLLQTEKAGELEQEVRAAEAALEISRSRKEELARQDEASGARQKELDLLFASNREALAALREECAAARSRLQALQEMDGRSGDGKAGAVPPSGATRRVADCLTVPKDEEQAFESFLGERLRALIVEKGSSPESLLNWSRGLAGRNRLCLSAEVPGRPVAWEGGTPLKELLSVEGDDRALLDNLLDGVYLVESLDPFLSGRIPRGVTLVSRAGEVLSWRGEVVVGASAESGSGLLTRKRMRRELEACLRDQDLERTRLEQQRQVLEEEQTALEKGRREAAAALKDEAESETQAERRAADLDNAVKRVRDRLEVLALEQEQLQEDQERLRDESVRSLQEGTSRDGEKNRLQAELKTAQDDFDDFRREVGRIREVVTQDKIRQAGREERRRSTGKRLEACRTTLEDVAARFERFKSRSEENHRERERLEAERETLEARGRELSPLRAEEQKKLTLFESAAAEARRRLDEADENLRTLRGAQAGEQEALNGLRLHLQEKSLEREHLRRATLERFRCDLELQAGEPAEDWDEQRQEARRSELQRQLDNIGEVNLTALEEFQALEERLAFLVSQQSDLTASVADLEATIHRINSTTCRRFREAFEQINARFQQVFPRLFSGGRAELRLTDAGNLLETGVEIVAQPPGKRLQELGLLSGGEKALTAIALIFSTFMVRPSPFCLLDEVEAPLDDANTDRYNGLIQELAKKSQFIIITHNKRTMGIGDALYGITMEEQGVSKVVSVRINDFR